MSETKSIIESPVKFMFTSDGVNYFVQRNKPLSKYRLADGSEEYGFHMTDVEPESFQRILISGFVSKIEMAVDNLVAMRPHIMEFCKILGYAMLFRQFDTHMYDVLMNSDLIVHWNRQNPRRSINYGTRISDSVLQSMLIKNKQRILDIKRDILSSLRDDVVANEGLLEEEKREQFYLAGRYINSINGLMWFMLTAHHNSDEYRGLTSHIVQDLKQYIRKAQIPEYLSLLVIELIINVANIRPDPIQDELAVLRTAPDKRVYVTFKISQKHGTPNERSRMQLTISNEKSEFHDLQERVDKKAHAQLREKSLQDFYGGEGDEELGLYYLSYLAEACKKVDVRFESFVNEVPNTHKTLMNLVMNF